MKNIIWKIIDKLNIYEYCGCDACHWEAWDFRLFYWVKDWDERKPKWVFVLRLW